MTELPCDPKNRSDDLAPRPVIKKPLPRWLAVPKTGTASELLWKSRRPMAQQSG